MKPSSSSSTLPSSASKSPSVSFFDLEGRFQRIFNCGGACSTSSDVEAEAEYALLSGITTTTTMYHQASYDADESEREEDQTESARDYFERISKLPVNKDTDTQNQTSKKNETKEIRQEEEEPQPTTTATVATTTPPTLKKSLTEVVFQFVKPTPQFGSYLKRTDSDSTQSTQAMSIDDDDDHDDDGLSFTSDSESRDAYEPLELVSILRRKEKHGAIAASTNSTAAAGVSFSKCTVFPDPNEGPQKRKPVRRIKKRKTAMMTTVPASGPGGFVVMKYDGTSSNTNNMSHKDSELRRLERRAQQQQYKQRNDILLTEGFYTFR